MTIRLLKLFLYAATIVTIGAGLIGLVAVVGNAAGGSAAATTLPLRIDPATSTVIKDASGASVGTLLLDRGTLNVRSGGLGYSALQSLDIVLLADFGSAFSCWRCAHGPDRRRPAIQRDCDPTPSPHWLDANRFKIWYWFVKLRCRRSCFPQSTRLPAITGFFPPSRRASAVFATPGSTVSLASAYLLEERLCFFCRRPSGSALRCAKRMS